MSDEKTETFEDYVSMGRAAKTGKPVFELEAV